MKVMGLMKNFFPKPVGASCASWTSWLALGVLATLGAQQTSPQQAPTFRGGATLVAVDVRVLDRDGKPVTDLQRADFTILEDGRPQQLRHFSVEMLSAGAPGPVARPTARAGTVNEPLVPPTHRTFLVVLGRGRLQYPAKGVDGVMHLVRDRLLPQDEIAVMAFNRATDFTTDHEAIAQVVDRFKKRHESIEAKLRSMQSGLAAVYGGTAIPKQLQGEIDAIFHGPGTPGVREVPAEPISAAGRIADDQRRLADAVQRTETRQGAPDLDVFAANDAATLGLSFDEYVETNLQTMQDLGNLYTGVEYLRHIEGEKHLIYISENGMLLPRVEDDKSLAARANGARVVVDTILTGGVAAGPPMAAMSSRMAGAPPPSLTPPLTLMFRGMAGRQISDLTGGQFTQTSYADKMIDRIDQTTRAEYLLGYSPSNGALDGRYRRIVVRVNRPGVVVLFRHGYYADERLPVLDRVQMLTNSRISAAGSYTGEVRDVRFTPKASSSGGQVTVDLIIDASTVLLRDDPTTGLHVGNLSISIFCGDGRQQVVGELSQKMALNLKDETRTRFLQDGISYHAEVAVTAPVKFVKVIVYDAAADKIGSQVVTIK